MDKRELIEILIELRSASIQINYDPSVWHDIMRKYNILFLGEKFNTILSIELAHSIKTIFQIPVELSDLNKVIPTVCDTLNMEYTPLINAEDSGKPNPQIAAYHINLW